MWYENSGFLWAAATAVGVILGGLWILLMFADFLARRVWQWVDDADGTVDSVFEHFVMFKCLKYRLAPAGSIYCYERSDGSGRTDGVFQMWVLPPLILLFSCWILYLVYRFPWVFATLGVLALVLFISRSLRRLLKRFEAHEKDKSAHQ